MAIKARELIVRIKIHAFVPGSFIASALLRCILQGVSLRFRIGNSISRAAAATEA
jgi:hypothetical protein